MALKDDDLELIAGVPEIKRFGEILAKHLDGAQQALDEWLETLEIPNIEPAESQEQLKPVVKELNKEKIEAKSVLEKREKKQSQADREHEIAHSRAIEESDIAVRLPEDNEERGKKDAAKWLEENPQFKVGEESEE